MKIEFDTSGLHVWLKGVVIILLLLQFYNAIRANYINPQDGERVLVTAENTMTFAQQIDRLYEIAIFPSRAVRWHSVFIGGFIGSTIATWIICDYPLTIFSTFLASFLPTFMVSLAFANFHSYHSPAQAHTKHATQLRVRLSEYVAKLPKENM